MGGRKDLEAGRALESEGMALTSLGVFSHTPPEQTLAGLFVRALAPTSPGHVSKEYRAQSGAGVRQTAQPQPRHEIQ